MPTLTGAAGASETASAGSLVWERGRKLLDQMRKNPRGDWTIGDIERVCKQLGISCEPPTRGSHHKVSSEHVDGILMVPARKPIKPCYIRDFVGLVTVHMSACSSERKDG